MQTPFCKVNKIKASFFFILWLYAIYPAYSQEPWQSLSVDAEVSQATAIVLDNHDDAVIYAGFKKGLYKSTDGGGSWQILAAGIITRINFLLLDNEDAKIIYAASENGLFKSSDGGMNWQRIFSGKSADEKNVVSLALCPEAPKSIFIATSNGIFFSPVNLMTWQKIGGALSDARVHSIIADPADADTFFTASNKGLFKTKNRFASYEKVHSGFNTESEDSTTDIDSSQEEASTEDVFFRHIAINARDTKQIYAGTSSGVFVSLDGGGVWEKKVLSGLFNEEIRYVFLDTGDAVSKIYLATQQGVFRCKESSCEQIYEGQDFSQCNQLAKDSHSRLYLAADKGLFRYTLENTLPQKLSSYTYNEAHFRQAEPAIAEIQQAAINYAEVYPEKIANWRKQARLKALIPELSLDYDKTVTTALGATYDRVQVGPRDWGVSLNWDLADIVFSADQTSIDVRSRLMVQLRDDILNEVTRLYFERKRLQLELSRSEGLNEKSKLEKELRLEELTASIDGLTGGYMSQKLKKQQ